MTVLRLAAILALCVTPSVAAQPGRAEAFVAEFERACVPGRLTYAATLSASAAAGWTSVASEAHPELAAVMAMSKAEADSLAADPDFSETQFNSASFAKLVGGRPHYLVVSRSSAVIDGAGDRNNPWVFVGCYLYDFDASEPLDPAAVTALVGNPISRSEERDGVVANVWGPPCPMPRTGDTYLSFVPDGSTTVVPFSGVALNFSTSELPEGEPVPDPYC